MAKDLTEYLRRLLNDQTLTLTVDQETAMRVFGNFIRSEEMFSTLLLTGSAGTGKTFMVNIFSRILKQQGFKVILLAPTGRAAKVITKRSKRLAFTIHHHIYSPLESMGGDLFFSLKRNKRPTETVYIVDEASMIGSKSEGRDSKGLLGDLVQFAFDQDPYRKLILVGDPVQLPPVGHNQSPALDPDTLRRKHHLEVFPARLGEVKRQVFDSEVLENAIMVRDAYEAGDPQGLALNPGREVQILEGEWNAVETYMGYFRPGDQDKVLFITYSNWLAARVNQAIRHELFGTEELIVPDDLLMVVRNNYAVPDAKRLPFIANGEMGTVRHVEPESYEERYGLKWMDAEVEFLDSRGEPIMVSAKLILDLLNDKRPQIEDEILSGVFSARRAEYQHLPKGQAMTLLRTDPYINALQIKYGYAVTGHKAQGGQWQSVIIAFEPDYGNDPLNYIRWTYTVLTRAEEQAFLLNCPFVDQF